MKRKNNNGNLTQSMLPRMLPRAGVSAVAAAVAGILSCATGAQVYAADAADTATTAPPASESSDLQEIIVTASAQGVRKLDASYNVVSVTLEEIKNANPASVADI